MATILSRPQKLRCNECIHVTCHKPVWYNMTNEGAVGKNNYPDLNIANRGLCNWPVNVMRQLFR